ncbi:MAG: S24 family peptidase [Thiomonas sp.]|uniref:LexA family protein n=1 Tax=Thiomonas sp. TaxID=2047785 RepID=UPI002A35CFD6|nr:S24 family peptidase [Thiomonas sp.]MDY0331802.1 S24 family peptidase [Thiomonas sp.]
MGKVLERLRLQGFLDRTPDGVWIVTLKFFERFIAEQSVQAGDPAPDAESGGTTTLLDELLVDTPSRTLLITVRGDSMNGANIFEGDVVVVERQTTASPGEIVVAAVDGELTVKRLKRDAQGWLLHPENPSYADIRPKGGLELVGVVTGLARRFRRSAP